VSKPTKKNAEMKATVFKTDLQFITPGQTSRGVLYSKPSWIIHLEDSSHIGRGECSVIPGLNPEYDDTYEGKIQEVIDRINQNDIPLFSELDDYPSIRFGLETALLDLMSNEEGILFHSPFTEGKAGIPINGLIWMGSKTEMKERIGEKLNGGYRVLKLKVGSLAFSTELDLIREIRREFSPDTLEIRLDANGAFSVEDAMNTLDQLSQFHIHSIEQPIKAGNWDAMASLCRMSPIPIALDEELIGVTDNQLMDRMLEIIKPQYIILKPSLTGGLSKSKEWIDKATKLKIGWWATSALESNIGLNAIAQWVFTLGPTMVQGLGTGQVFSNNIPSPLFIKKDLLCYVKDKPWDFRSLKI
jgi:o-succinylbenzoate synthase